MRRIIKKTLKRFALGILILGLLGFILVMIFHNDIEELLITRVQSNLAELEYGDLEIGDLDLLLFRHFPNISVKIKEVRFYESKDPLRPKDLSPIFFSENLNLAFDSWELIWNKNLVVTSLSIKSGVFDLLTYEDNKTNLERALTKPQLASRQPKLLDSLVTRKNKPKPTKSSPKKKESGSEPSLLSIDLEGIQMENITLKYSNPSEQYSSQIELATLEGNLLFDMKGISCDLKTSFEVTKSTIFPIIKEQGPASLSLKFDFVAASQKIEIEEGSLSFENFAMTLEGLYDHKNGNYLDMEFDASSNNMSFLSKLLQEDLIAQNSSLIEKADIILNGHVQGKMEDNIPKIDINFDVKDLNIVVPVGNGKFSNLGFEGELHTGKAQDLSEAKLSIRNLRGETPGGTISGNFHVNNFENPYVKSNINMSLILDGYDKVFNLPYIDSLQGKITFVSEIDGLLNLESEHEMDSIGGWTLEMEGVGFKYLPSNNYFSDLNGKIKFQDTEIGLILDIEDFDLSFKPHESNIYFLENLNLKIAELYFLHDEGTSKISGVKSVEGELHVDFISTPSFKNGPFDISFSGDNDTFNVDFTTLEDTTLSDKGSIVLDLSQDSFVFDLLYEIENFPIESAIEDYTTEQLIDGSLDAQIKLSGNGASLEEIETSLKGNVNISGDSLVLYGIDLDDLLMKYKRSQKFNLTDITAYVIVGPFGAVVTKGADFTSLISAELNPEDRTEVSKAIANWSIDQGLIMTKDVAFSTNKNRVAFKGSLDFINDSIPGFTTYVIDKNGCSLMEQTFYGKFDNLEMGELKIAETILGSVINFVKSIVGIRCEVVYTGAIEQPNLTK